MKYLDIPYYKQDTTYTCGPTSLQMVFAHFGVIVSEDELRRELSTDKDTGTKHQAMIDSVLDRGFHCYVNNESSKDEIVQYVTDEFPVIVRFVEPSTNDDHYSVVVGVSSSDIALNDPWNGERLHFSWKEFENRWTCDTLGTCNRWCMVISRDPFSLGKQYHPHE